MVINFENSSISYCLISLIVGTTIMALFTQQSLTFVLYLELIATLMIKWRLGVVSLLGYDPFSIVLPIPIKEIESTLPLNDAFQRSLADFSREIFSHYPGREAWDFFRRTYFATSSIIHYYLTSDAPCFMLMALHQGNVVSLVP